MEIMELNIRLTKHERHTHFSYMYACMCVPRLEEGRGVHKVLVGKPE